ncbi:hypothetical protein I5G60_gp59 [Mycobacterium phage Saguaro]|uniref:Uncharacterized protein n=1 Tax=Mycobacterium phage Saguaro TaxID=2315616 RepID=A0A386K9X6_9CAUD|nr:hypothetical protein I5G60_gp59 [Mycobacterium phage Saguaro]AYD82053.1 hypothetical protein SEA_SAGUARO_59 [Mycobacterium phage Saguaro]
MAVEHTAATGNPTIDQSHPWKATDMTTPPGHIRDAAHLRTLPDGTIISWLRIPGDATSEAVAFVRRELSNESGVPQVDVWISPGGWEPQTIESAGVTFPCQVIRLGEFNPDHYLPTELPVLSEALAECTHGGTWAREKALECAVAYCAHNRRSASVLAMAETFAAWLEAGATADNDLPLSLRLERGADAIEQAREDLQRTEGVTMNIAGIRRYVEFLREQGR